MRNLLMKKFGTPTGTGPGRASENVGFIDVGMPLEWRSRVGRGRSRSPEGVLPRKRPRLSRTRPPLPPLRFLPPVSGCSRICSPACGCSPTTGAPGDCAGVVGLIVSEGPLLGGACAGVTSRMLRIGSPRLGSRMWSSGVSTPASTVTVLLMLPTSVTSNVRWAALAVSAKVPNPAAMPPDTTRAMSSLRLWCMCPCISPLEVCPNTRARCACAAAYREIRSRAKRDLNDHLGAISACAVDGTRPRCAGRPRATRARIASGRARRCASLTASIRRERARR